jgi:hypothetical protein
MKKYEKHLLIGTVLTFLGIILIYKLQLLLFAGWGILVFGKIC